MDSLANYGSDDENEAISSTNVNASSEPVQSRMEGDNYDDVQMEMSENPLNGSKAPSVQAHSPGTFRCGGAPHMAPPACATILSESGSESAVKDDDGNCSPLNPANNSSSSSPASTAQSHGSESDENDDSKSEDLLSSSAKVNTQEKLLKDKGALKPDKDQVRRDLESRSNRDKERERDRDKECDKDRSRDRDDKDRRRDYRREERHRSRSRDRRDRERSQDRSGRRRSKDRDSRRKSKERRSSSREYREHRNADRRRTETNRRDSDRKRHRSRSRSVDRHRPGTDSRSSSSSGSSKSDAHARSRDVKVLPSAGSRSRSKSQEKERSRTSSGDSRKFYMEKKIDRKLNVLERMGIELKAEAKASIGLVTPQMLVQRTMEQQVAQVKQATGVELPSYYNAAAVNPQRLVDQIQKRKLLWGAKKEDPSKAAAPSQTSNKWQGATFAQDQDGKLTAKFNRLMGIKQPVQAPAATSSGEGGSEIIKKQEEMFHNMESQYEVARLATHTHRGLGLGFGTFQHR
ncbi:arginine/serine-rich coiled-coil protein 2-like isoform X2 [Thrips palmi]|uniref:Arginine/serine-rich coiled-coil protein 2-like isoform X2 n=1 Tax=Thrips palmi TaxID=161013 RepID=A0A6P8YLM4_THRPL|nr:arginine/serine-rich coiled-coil protein 2-like isoform X2 [Thrips palmi]